VCKEILGYVLYTCTKADAVGLVARRAVFEIEVVELTRYSDPARILENVKITGKVRRKIVIIEAQCHTLYL
jgi:hypothetical protein